MIYLKFFARCPENDSGNQHHLIEHIETNKKVRIDWMRGWE